MVKVLSLLTLILILGYDLVTQATPATVNNYFMIDPSKIRQQPVQDPNAYHVSGQAVDTDGTGAGQLKIYVQDCGMLTIPKNSQGKAPKVGETITVSLKEPCKISDWN